MSAINLLEYTPSGRLSPKVACAVVLTLVFLSGGVVGALTMDLVVHNRPRPAAFDPVHGTEGYFQKMKHDLNLTGQQSVEIESTLKDFWQYYGTVLSDARQRIEIVLTPEQKVKFEQFLQEQRK